MPLFCFAFLAVAFALLFALPALSLAALFLELDRQLGFHFYDVAYGGDPLLWQNLFWIFGHPEVYIIILPAFGIATSIIPAFCHRRMVFFPLVALAEILVAFLGFGVWVHHMFTVGFATLTTVYFAAASLIIVIPSRDSDIRLDRHDRDRHPRLPHADVVHRRLHRLLHPRRACRGSPSPRSRLTSRSTTATTSSPTSTS